MREHNMAVTHTLHRFSVSGQVQGGGGVMTPTLDPPLVKHPPLDIVCVTSSALPKIVKHPHSWTFTSTHPPLDIVRVTSSALPPLDIARVTSSTFQGGGGGERSRSRTLCIGFQYQDKFKGGGGDHPYHHHPGSATGIYQVVTCFLSSVLVDNISLYSWCVSFVYLLQQLTINSNILYIFCIVMLVFMVPGIHVSISYILEANNKKNTIIINTLFIILYILVFLQVCRR